MIYQRNSLSEIQNGLRDTPVLLLLGARQSGKSTLAEWVMQKIPGMERFTFDDLNVASFAASSPVSFVDQLKCPALIDEVQRVPEIFLPLKKSIDDDRKPGRFLLTGSANVLVLPKLADSLAGRMEIHTLWPLSQGEIEGRKEGFIDQCFKNDRITFSAPPITWQDLVNRMVRGGYPEVVQREEPKRRKAWFSSYITSLLERDIRDLANIEGLKEIPYLLEILAARAGGLQNFSEVSRLSGITATTLKRYITLLESIFLHVELPAWFRNLEKRLIKAPKTYLNDTGLLCYLRGVNEDSLIADRHQAGPILENFVMMELKKQIAWSDISPKLYHYRNVSNREVDIVLQAAGGRIVGIEIKASAQVSSRDFLGINALAEDTKDAFVRGVVLYTGDRVIHFGDKLVAIPISALWRMDS